MRNKIIYWLINRLEKKRTGYKNEYHRVVDIATKKNKENCKFIYHDLPGAKIGLN